MDHKCFKLSRVRRVIILRYIEYYINLYNTMEFNTKKKYMHPLIIFQELSGILIAIVCFLQAYC